MKKTYLLILFFLTCFLSVPSHAIRVSIVNDTVDELLQKGTSTNAYSFRQILDNIEKPETNIRMKKITRTSEIAKQIINSSEKEIEENISSLESFPYMVSSAQNIVNLCKSVYQQPSNNEDIIAISFILESLACKL